MGRRRGVITVRIDVPRIQSNILAQEGGRLSEAAIRSWLRNSGFTPVSGDTLLADDEAIRRLGRREVAVGGAVDHATVRVEPRAVAWAVPRPLAVVPSDDAPHVRADGGALVELVASIPEDRHLRHAAPHHGPGTRGDLRER